MKIVENDKIIGGAFQALPADHWTRSVQVGDAFMIFFGAQGAMLGEVLPFPDLPSFDDYRNHEDALRACVGISSLFEELTESTTVIIPRHTLSMKLSLAHFQEIKAARFDWVVAHRLIMQEFHARHAAKEIDEEFAVALDTAYSIIRTAMIPAETSERVN